MNCPNHFPKDLWAKSLEEDMAQIFSRNNPEDYLTNNLLYQTETGEQHGFGDIIEKGLEDIKKQRYGRTRQHNSKPTRIRPKNKIIVKLQKRSELPEDDDIFRLKLHSESLEILDGDGKPIEPSPVHETKDDTGKWYITAGFGLIFSTNKHLLEKIQYITKGFSTNQKYEWLLDNLDLIHKQIDILWN